jgi:hypothetical protein
METNQFLCKLIQLNIHADLASILIVVFMSQNCKGTNFGVPRPATMESKAQYQSEIQRIEPIVKYDKFGLKVITFKKKF